jgi:5-formyltetrahydrofolate cyclo-ligase family
VDLVICGSVVVNHQGVRIGKGGGFSDLEVALLIEAGVLRPSTVLVTTVHPLQVVDEPLPETVHDFRVDLIVTRTRSSGAASRAGHPESSGSISTRTRSPGARGPGGRTLRAPVGFRTGALGRAGVRLITLMEVIDWPSRRLAFGHDWPVGLAQSIKGRSSESIGRTST